MSWDPITVQMTRALSEFSEEENERIRKHMKTAALSCRRELKQTSPKMFGEYANGWRFKKKESKLQCEYIIYNATKPGLTHLLENSHMIENQFGRYGRTSPGHGQYIHIKPAAENAEELLIDLLVGDL